jgi:hypothetical protein
MESRRVGDTKEFYDDHDTVTNCSLSFVLVGAGLFGQQNPLKESGLPHVLKNRETHNGQLP